jgi:hypothetical protein
VVTKKCIAPDLAGVPAKFIKDRKINELSYYPILKRLFNKGPIK